MKKKIKIGYDDIVIQKVDFTPQKQNDALGEFKASSSIIEIAKGMTPRQEANTLLHEVLHGCVYQTGLNSDGGALSKDDSEELTVNALANSISQVIRDNKWFLPYLQNAISGGLDGVEKSRIKVVPKNKKTHKRRALSKNRNKYNSRRS